MSGSCSSRGDILANGMPNASRQVLQTVRHANASAYEYAVIDGAI
jgi:hypothetical protein